MNNNDDNIVDLNKYKDSKKFEELNTYMNSHDSTKNFQSRIATSSANSVAFETSIKARQASRQISHVDKNVVSSDLSKITSKSCGATIDKQATIRKNKSHQKYIARKKQLHRRLICGLLASMALLGVGGSYAKNKITEKNLSLDYNQEKGYNILVSKNTQDKLNNIKNAIERVKSLGIEPSKETLSEIKSELDFVIDDVISDLVTKAFEEKNPDLKVICVETKYDKAANKYLADDAPEPHPENFCTIFYEDEKGESNKTVMNFDSDIVQSFDNEYSLDYENLTLSDLEKIYKDTSHLAGKEFEYHKGKFFGDSISSGIPNKVSKTDTSKTNDDLEK